MYMEPHWLVLVWLQYYVMWVELSAGVFFVFKI